MRDFFLGRDFGKSRAQLEKEREAFRRLIFPFGDEHKKKIEELLSHICLDTKRREDLLFAFVSGKELLQKSGEIPEVALLLRRLPTRLSDAQTRLIVSLIVLDSQADSLSDLPSIDKVRAFSESLAL